MSRELRIFRLEEWLLRSLLAFIRLIIREAVLLIEERYFIGR